jgi:DNA-binding transcriptional MerR regulator
MILAIKAQPELFTTRELEEIERRWSEGIPSQEVISLFQTRGVKLSEATFRKYVQLGLLPTSRRVGRKGKHRGSRGLYPVSVVRRINVIKRMMAEDLTLEQIRDSFFSVQNELERTGEAMDGLIASLLAHVERLKERGEPTTDVARELKEAQKISKSLLKKIERIQSRLAIIGSRSTPKDQGGLP